MTDFGGQLMKLKSLILGSVAAAGLSTAAFAADLGVLTSLDVCDELGLSGLTISSDTNCLQISGKVSYEFNFGNWRDNPNAPFTLAGIIGANGLGVGGYSLKDIDAPATAGQVNDWESK